MSSDKFHDEKVYEAGYRAGWNGIGKVANPKRDSGAEDEGRWDFGYKDGAEHRTKSDAGGPLPPLNKE